MKHHRWGPASGLSQWWVRGRERHRLSVRPVNISQTLTHVSGERGVCRHPEFSGFYFSGGGEWWGSGRGVKHRNSHPCTHGRSRCPRKQKNSKMFDFRIRQSIHSVLLCILYLFFVYPVWSLSCVFVIYEFIWWFALCRFLESVRNSVSDAREFSGRILTTKVKNVDTILEWRYIDKKCMLQQVIWFCYA